MREDDVPVAAPKAGVVGAGDLSFAAFSLAHAGCGDGVVELRLGDRLLLEWCPACASMATFGFPEDGGGPKSGVPV